MKKFKISMYICLISFILLNLILIYKINISKNNLNNYFRLHVVANSDNISDQLLKLEVSNSVTKYIQTLTNNITNKEIYILTIKNNIQNILEVAKETLKSHDSSYTLAAYIGNIKYEDKQFNDLHMNAGTYNSLKIAIGEGNGSNWWSLLYSSLPNNADINEALTDDKVIFKSKILEWIDYIFN